MERTNRPNVLRKAGGGTKDVPICERCGKVVRISSADYSSDEILCPSCAGDARVIDPEDSEEASEG